MKKVLSLLVAVLLVSPMLVIAPRRVVAKSLLEQARDFFIAKTNASDGEDVNENEDSEVSDDGDEEDVNENEDSEVSDDGDEAGKIENRLRDTLKKAEDFKRELIGIGRGLGKDNEFRALIHDISNNNGRKMREKMRKKIKERKEKVRKRLEHLFAQDVDTGDAGNGMDALLSETDNPNIRGQLMKLLNKKRPKHKLKKMERSLRKLSKGMREKFLEEMDDHDQEDPEMDDEDREVEAEDKVDMESDLEMLPAIPESMRTDFLDKKMKIRELAKSLRKEMKALRKKNKKLGKAMDELEKINRKMKKRHFIGETMDMLQSKITDLKQSFKDGNITAREAHDQIKKFKHSVHDISKKNRMKKLAEGMIPFADTPDDEGDSDLHGWNPAFFEHVKRLKDRGIIKGFADGTFGPDRKITRAELLKIALGGSGENLNFDGPDANVGDFRDLHDVPKWQRILFRKARDLGVVGGSAQADPQRPATRAEAVRYILRAYGIEPKQVAKKIFHDIAGQDAPAIETAGDLGIVKGIGSGQFGPDMTVTRAEMAKIISNTETALADQPVISDTTPPATTDSTVPVTTP